MRCLSPINVVNPQKCVDTNVYHKMLLTVRCGKCAACQTTLSNQWLFRIYHHWLSSVKSGRYVYYITLTYREHDVPRFSNHSEFAGIGVTNNSYCFDRSHIVGFRSRLRSKLRRRGFQSDVFDYFISSEYGTDPSRTQRPHFHCLFFCNNDVDPLLFSRLIDQSWSYGLTDGVSYQSQAYVLGNVFRTLGPTAFRKMRYVSKYVVKNSHYSDILRKRIQSAMYSRFGFDLDKHNSLEGRDLRRRLYIVARQFHTQSPFFGLSAIEDVDLDSLIDSGSFTMPSYDKNFVLRVPVSSYFLRKLFYNKVSQNGLEFWQPTQFAIPYLKRRHDKVIKSIANNYRELSVNSLNTIIDFGSYLDFRGNLSKVSYEPRSVNDVVIESNLFVYASSSDRSHFGTSIVSDCYLGCKDNYFTVPAGARLLRLKDFVDSSVYVRPDFESLISKLDEYSKTQGVAKQAKLDHQQYISNLYKSVGLIT